MRNNQLCSIRIWRLWQHCQIYMMAVELKPKVLLTRHPLRNQKRFHAEQKVKQAEKKRVQSQCLTNSCVILNKNFSDASADMIQASATTINYLLPYVQTDFNVQMKFHDFLKQWIMWNALEEADELRLLAFRSPDRHTRLTWMHGGQSKHIAEDSYPHE